ncbi:MAG: tetratricopeptide repeat protein [FCB group bacterium]|nr:tetratricopeptide repeat protein [FCB group bacterium]
MNKGVKLVMVLGAVFLAVVVGQPQNIPPGAGALRTAQLLERQGDLDGAIAIYEGLVQKNPRNNFAYRRLKDLYKRQNRLDQAIILVLDHLKYYPSDLQAQVELGEIYLLKKDEKAARDVWADFEQQFGDNPNTYRILMQTYIRLGMEPEMTAVIERGRARFHNPSMLALELADFYNARRTYDKALDEYLLYVTYNPRHKKLVTNKILMMSDEPENHSLIEQRLLENIPRNEPLLREILAAFYFKTGRYQDALAQHRLLKMESKNDFDRWLTFANNLRLEGQYPTALEAYEIILSKSGSPTVPTGVIGKALLGMAKTFEDQIVPGQESTGLVRYFPDNVFFENHFYDSPDLSAASIEAAFQMYDSILVSLPATAFSAEANYRLGEIQYRATRNFDGALRSYEAALRSNPSRQLEEKIRLRIGDLLLARGDIPQTIDYFNREKDRSITFKNRLIQAYFLAGELDSATTLIETTMRNILPTAKEFNDLMELRDLIQQHYLNGNEDDKTAFRTYLLGEFLVRQHKLSEAAETFAFLREKFPTASITALATLREALIRVTLNQIPQALSLAQDLTQTPLADKGWVLTGEIIENRENDPQKALDYYHKILEDYPGSLLVEPVRFHIRALNQQLKRG